MNYCSRCVGPPAVWHLRVNLRSILLHPCKRIGTDGTGWNNLIVPAGGFRNPRNESTSIPKERERKNIRSGEDLFMDGAEIFTFTLREVAPMVKNLLVDSKWSIDMVDFFVMHQAIPAVKLSHQPLQKRCL